MIPFFSTAITKEMKIAVFSALENENYVFGESVYKFEEEFAKYIGSKFAVSTNSGTSALFLSLLSLGINKKSKIITSTNSFIASASCIMMANAQPILCDIKPESGNIDLSKFGKKADAIIPVHIYGNPCDFDEILSLSEKLKIPIIEDAAQSHGATFRNKKTGILGDVGCFSFYPTKNMTVCGDGGMITTNNDDIAKKISSLRDNGRISRSVVDKLGFTMRLNTINAAIGRIQLKLLDKFNERRRKIFSLYQKYLPEEIFLHENPLGRSVYHQIVIKHKKRDQIQKHLTKNKIGTLIHYPIPIHKQPLFSKFRFSLPKSEKFSNEILSLPSFPQLKNEQIKIICENINKII